MGPEGPNFSRLPKGNMQRPPLACRALTKSAEVRSSHLGERVCAGAGVGAGACAEQATAATMPTPAKNLRNWRNILRPPRVDVRNDLDCIRAGTRLLEGRWILPRIYTLVCVCFPGLERLPY